MKRQQQHSFQSQKQIRNQRGYLDLHSLKEIKTNLYQDKNNDQMCSYFYCHKKHKKKEQSRKTACPILQAQQPQDFQTGFDIENKVSLITYGSQPSIFTRHNKNEQEKNIFQMSNKNPQVIKKSFINNKSSQGDNTKTMKYITKPTQVNGVNLYSDKNEEYYRLGNSKFRKEEKKYRKEGNLKTQRLNKSPCSHRNILDKETLSSLSDLNSRVTVCQAYVQLGQRKINLLIEQLNYLKYKECQKQQQRMDQISRGKSYDYMYKRHHHQKNSNLDSQKHKNLHLNNQRQRGQPMQEEFSLIRFHNKSSENKPTRMRQLLYFNEYQKKRLQQPIINSQPIRQPQAKNHQRLKNQQIQYTKQLKSNKKPSRNQTQRQQQNRISYINSRILKQNKKEIQPKQYVQNYNQREDKSHSDKQFNPESQYRYSESSSFLLDQDDSLGKSKNISLSFQIQQNNVPLQMNVKCVKSQKANKKDDQSRLEKIIQNKQGYQFKQNGQSQNYYQYSVYRHLAQQYGDQEGYLTKQFDADGVQIQGCVNNQKIYQCITKSKELQNGLYSSKKSRYLGHSKQTQRKNQLELANKLQSQIKENKSNRKMNQNALRNNDFDKKNKTSKNDKYQKHRIQYFNTINQPKDINVQLQEQLVIQSYFDSPIQLGNQSHAETQNQLIEQFNDLVIKAAQEQTPLQKRLIRQRIYRTSRQIKQLNKNLSKNKHNHLSNE